MMTSSSLALNPRPLVVGPPPAAPALAPSPLTPTVDSTFRPALLNTLRSLCLKAIACHLFHWIFDFKP